MERFEKITSPESRKVEAARIAQERINRIEKSRFGLGGLVLSAIGMALKGVIEKQGGSETSFMDIAKRNTLEILRRRSLKTESDYNDLVRLYEDQIELASGEEKRQLERELEAIKRRWTQARERREQDHDLLLRYFGLI
jgi:hypothetical protein